MDFISNKPSNGKLGDIIIENEKSKIMVNEAKTSEGEFPFFTSGQALLYVKDYIIDGQNIFLNTGGNADIKHYIGKASYSTDTWSIKAIDKLTDYLYILLFISKSEINDNYFEGSALKHLQKSNLKNKEIYIPTKDECIYLYSTLHPLITNIVDNLKQNRQLVKIRNLLLPKLMSGEIDVSKIDI